MKKKLIAMALVCITALSAFGMVASAINYDYSFYLTPNGSSDYSSLSYKGDKEPTCYITTTGGGVLSNNLTYKMRGKEYSNKVYPYIYGDATELRTYNRSLYKEPIPYLGAYDYLFSINTMAEIAKYPFSLASSLHSGTNNVGYALYGVWNP